MISHLCLSLKGGIEQNKVTADLRTRGFLNKFFRDTNIFVFNGERYFKTNTNGGEYGYVKTVIYA